MLQFLIQKKCQNNLKFDDILWHVQWHYLECLVPFRGMFGDIPHEFPKISGEISWRHSREYNTPPIACITFAIPVFLVLYIYIFFLPNQKMNPISPSYWQMPCTLMILTETQLVSFINIPPHLSVTLPHTYL